MSTNKEQPIESQENSVRKEVNNPMNIILIQLLPKLLPNFAEQKTYQPILA